MIAFMIVTIPATTILDYLKEQKSLQNCLSQALIPLQTALCRKIKRIDLNSSKDQPLVLFFCRPRLVFSGRFSLSLPQLLSTMTPFLKATFLRIYGVGQEWKELDGYKINADIGYLNLLLLVWPILYISFFSLHVFVV